MDMSLAGNVTKLMASRSAMLRARDPARRFARAKDINVPDSDLEVPEYQLRCLLYQMRPSTPYPAPTSMEVIDIYDVFLFAEQRKLILCLFVAGNTYEEVAKKSDISLDQAKIFSYFFCCSEFLFLSPAAKRAVIMSQECTYSQDADLLLMLNMSKICADMHFNIEVRDMKKHRQAMQEDLVMSSYYLAAKDVHYVKPGTKAFTSVMDAIERANSSLTEVSGGDKGVVEEVLKAFEEMKEKEVIVPAPNKEDLNVPPIPEEDKK